MELAFGRRAEDIVDYLNDNPLNLMLDDWSRVCGDEHFPAPAEPYNPFDVQQIRAIDWQGGGVDIRVEYADNRGRVLNNSIQLFLARQLDLVENAVVYWDHGSGEAADFIVLRPAAHDGVDVTLYHCKGAGGAQPGNRVDDVYEVCAQAVKSMIWCDLPRLVDRSLDRMRRGKGVGRLVRGDEARMLELATRRPVKFGMVVVQPGISRGNLEPRLAEVLAASSYYLVRGGHQQLEVWASA